MQERECSECYGDGTVEVGPVCSMPASMCCGGCTEIYQCETCKGSGYEEYEDEETEGE
jgi:hypothetical protein